MIIYNKLDNYFIVSADRQKILGFEMSANLRDTSPLRIFFKVNNRHISSDGTKLRITLRNNGNLLFIYRTKDGFQVLYKPEV